METCAKRVAEDYTQLKGMDEASAVLTFMAIAQTLPQYGMQIFSVKDKAGVPWKLGISFRGISQFYYSNPHTPRQVICLTLISAMILLQLFLMFTPHIYSCNKRCPPHHHPLPAILLLLIFFGITSDIFLGDYI